MTCIAFLSFSLFFFFSSLFSLRSLALFYPAYLSIIIYYCVALIWLY